MFEIGLVDRQRQTLNVLRAMAESKARPFEAVSERFIFTAFESDCFRKGWSVIPANQLRVFAMKPTEISFIERGRTQRQVKLPTVIKSQAVAGAAERHIRYDYPMSDDSIRFETVTSSKKRDRNLLRIRFANKYGSIFFTSEDPTKEYIELYSGDHLEFRIKKEVFEAVELFTLVGSMVYEGDVIGAVPLGLEFDAAMPRRKDERSELSATDPETVICQYLAEVCLRYAVRLSNWNQATLPAWMHDLPHDLTEAVFPRLCLKLPPKINPVKHSLSVIFPNIHKALNDNGKNAFLEWAREKSPVTARCAGKIVSFEPTDFEWVTVSVQTPKGRRVAAAVPNAKSLDKVEGDEIEAGEILTHLTLQDQAKSYRTFDDAYAGFVGGGPDTIYEAVFGWLNEVCWLRVFEGLGYFPAWAFDNDIVQQTKTISGTSMAYDFRAMFESGVPVEDTVVVCPPSTIAEARATEFGIGRLAIA